METTLESDVTFTVILVYFNGRYFEGGSFDGATARQLYGSACKNRSVYRAELLSYERSAGWRLLAQNVKPIAPRWYEERGLT